MYSKEEAKRELTKLIDKFERNPRKDSLSETETREYIRRLFEILGWDFLGGKEVTQEEQVSRGFVDYGFRLNEIPVMFVEAKRTSADLQDEKSVNQAMDYAWHKATTWAVLTNFRRIRIFNSYIRVKEHKIAAQFRDLEIGDYLSQFDDLWLLSKESFEKGIIDKQAEKEGKKAKEKPVEKQLFEDLNKWREELAKDIKKRYGDKYSAEVIDEIVQLILDRLILIRKIEDEGLESRKIEECLNTWQSQTKKSLWKYLRELFIKFNDIYDSRIFEPHEVDSLELSDSPLSNILEELYESQDKTIRYNFAIVDADVLGSIYEQYLGYLLKTTKKRAKVSEKRAIRKEHGIYYTPTYVVNYIMRNTLGERLKKCKSWQEVEKIKILDPACGSGSFLIKAFDAINEWYEQKGLKKEKLTLTEKGFETIKDKIIKKNLFGVDLDPKAVEIARLNLLLRTADKKHKLPILKDNIKIGDSLIDESSLTPYPFNWRLEFDDILKKGGFDLIIGNPPWVESKKFEKRQKNFYEKKYKVAKKQYDLFTLFIEESLSHLKDKGVLGFIVPDRFISNLDYAPFRKFLLHNSRILKIIHVGEGVFKGVDMPSAILIVQKESKQDLRRNNNVDYAMVKTQNLTQIEYSTKPQYTFEKNEGFVFSVFSTSLEDEILSKVDSNSMPFGELVDNARGVEIGKKSPLISANKEGINYVEFLVGEDIGRYMIKGSRYLRLGDKKIDYKLPSLYKGAKILVRKTGKGINAVIDEKGRYVIQVIYIFKPKTKTYDPFFLLGILNSKLMSFYYFSRFGEKERKTFPHLTQGKVLRLPIVKLQVKDQKYYNLLITYVKDILILNQKLVDLHGKKISEQEILGDQIKRVDTLIDELIYKLYKITGEEKKIVEEAVK